MLDNVWFLFLFSDDEGTSCKIICGDCGNAPCVWEMNIKGVNNIFPKQRRERRHSQINNATASMYRQMVPIINDAPSSRGNRMKLPNCVLAGVWGLFPNPEAVYTGPKDVLLAYR
jgi:hypothetical protein